MCIGDGATQLTIENEGPWQGGESLRHLDAVRNTTSSIFQGLAGMFMGTWWRFLDYRIPGTTISKLAINQVALSGTITPAFLVWSGTTESLLRGDAIDWTGLSQRLMTELPTLLPTSFCFWLPFNTFNFMVTPVHLRVAFVSGVSVAWGGYLSYVSHGRRGNLSIPRMGKASPD